MMKFDAVIIGGGLAGMSIATALQEDGRRCALVSEGLSLHDGVSAARFRAAGGTLLAGDRVTAGTFGNGKLLSVRTEKLGDATLEAPVFVLATGKYFSRGIVADMDSIYEPVFGLDVQFDKDRSAWFSPSFSAPQRFLEFGVLTKDGCALKDGEKIANLFPAGEVLAGVSCISEGGTAGITHSVSLALEAIRKI